MGADRESECEAWQLRRQLRRRLKRQLGREAAIEHRTCWKATTASGAPSVNPDGER